MQANEVRADARRRRKTCFLVVLCLAVAGILGIPGFAARRGGSLREKVPQEPVKVSLSVQDPRPVAKAIVMLEARYGLIITYEDPRYAYADDIADVTEKVRNDLHKYREGEARRVLIPKGGELSFDYYVTSQTGLPPDPVVVVQQLLAAQAASANSGRFRIENGDKIIHVIPTTIRGKSGRLTNQQAVLDTVVTLPAKERTALQTLEALCAAITNVTQTRVVVGAVPLNLFIPHKDQHGIVGLNAREVLVQLFERMNKGIKLSWQLFYDSGMKMYVLNIHVV